MRIEYYSNNFTSLKLACPLSHRMKPSIIICRKLSVKAIICRVSGDSESSGQLHVKLAAPLLYLENGITYRSPHCLKIFRKRSVKRKNLPLISGLESFKPKWRPWSYYTVSFILSERGSASFKQILKYMPLYLM